MTERCLALVKHFEGFSPVPYKDIAGFWTIGYGHVILPNETFVEITEQEAEELLIQDLLKREKVLKRLIVPKIHEWMLDGLLSFVFNVGLFAFKASAMRQKINRNEFRQAGDEFLKWIYAGGKPVKGLIRRRKAERELYLEGVEEWIAGMY